MPTETAQMVVAGIAAVGFIVWLVGLQFLLNSARAGKPAEADPLADPATALPAGWLTGSAEVAGQPADLARRAAALLAKGGALGLLKITDCTDRRLSFEPATGRAVPGLVGKGEMRFAAAGPNRTRIDYALERGDFRWLLGLGWLFQIMGLVALAVGAWALLTFVAPNPNPAIRWQVVQMVHVIHFLWPPFLCGALYRRFRTAGSAAVDAFVHNLPYVEA